MRGNWFQASLCVRFTIGEQQGVRDGIWRQELRGEAFCFCLFLIQNLPLASVRPRQQQPLLLGKDGKGACRRHQWSQWNLFQRCTESYRAEPGSSGTGSPRESFENSWILEKKWPRDKAGGNSIKQATKVNFMKAKLRLHGWLWLIWKLRWRALLFWIRNREPLLPRSPSEGFLAVWAAAVGLYKMSWEGSSFLWSMPFISTWLFGFIPYPTEIIYCEQCGLSQQQQTVFQFGRPEGPAWGCWDWSEHACRATLLSECSRGKSFALPFPFPVVACIPWLVASASIFKASKCLTLRSASAIPSSDSAFPATPCTHIDCWEPLCRPGWSGPLSLPEDPCPHLPVPFVTPSWVLGIRVWASEWGGMCPAYHSASAYYRIEARAATCVVVKLKLCGQIHWIFRLPPPSPALWLLSVCFLIWQWDNNQTHLIKSWWGPIIELHIYVHVHVHVWHTCDHGMSITFNRKKQMLWLVKYCIIIW